MKNYFVEWEIGIKANSPEDAAREALAIQRDANSIATFFRVINEIGEITEIDITKIDNRE